MQVRKIWVLAKQQLHCWECECTGTVICTLRMFNVGDCQYLVDVHASGVYCS